jgi:hypothetical protein
MVGQGYYEWDYFPVHFLNKLIINVDFASCYFAESFLGVFWWNIEGIFTI